MSAPWSDDSIRRDRSLDTWIGAAACLIGLGCCELGGCGLGCSRPQTPTGANSGPDTTKPAVPAYPRASSSPAPAPSGPSSDERQSERDAMVKLHMEARGIENRAVLTAMRRVPRHRFVPQHLGGEAYADRPLPIGFGQTISQPYIVAFMTEAAAPRPTDKCLEIGTGSGYQAAVLSELCAATFSIEYLPEVAAIGKRNLAAAGYLSVQLRVGDGYRGWPEAAPFDVILVTAAPDHVPAPLLDQLAVKGRLVIPVGPQTTGQELERYTRVKQGKGPKALVVEQLLSVRFVPFLGDRAN